MIRLMSVCLVLFVTVFFTFQVNGEEIKTNSTMKILAIGTLLPGVTMADTQRYGKVEAEKVWELYSKGIFREFYLSSEDTPRSVIILECSDVEEAKKVINTLPLVANKITSFQFIPIGPFFPLAALFSSEKTIEKKSK